jgi:hypothetical protein
MKTPWAKKSDDVPRRRRSDGSEQDTERETAERPGSSLFKRNRTLVGSLSARVSSANELGGDLRSPRAHIHHLTAHRRRLSSVLAVVLLAAGALTWFLYEFTAVIQPVPTDSSVSLNDGRYQRVINDYFAMHPLERLRPLVNVQQLGEYLTTLTPEVAAIRSNNSAGLATSEFDITLRRPVAGWLINSKQYFVDKNGVTFQKNYFENPTVKIADQSGVPLSSGVSVVSSQFLHFVGRTVDQAKGRGMIIEQAVIPANTTRQVEVRLVGHKYPIKLSLDRPEGEQVEDMQRAVAYFDAHGTTPEYVDVRVSGKAFYR